MDFTDYLFLEACRIKAIYDNQKNKKSSKKAIDDMLTIWEGYKIIATKMEQFLIISQVLSICYEMKNT